MMSCYHNYRPLKFEKAKVALEKQTRRRTRQIFDAQNELWEWTVTRRHPKEIKHWGQLTYNLLFKLRSVGANICTYINCKNF